jgi:hypothetical protein
LGPAFATILSVISWGAVVALVAAVVAAGLRRWRVAAAVSRAVVVLGPLVLLASLADFVVLPLVADAETQAAMRATVLSLGVSEAAGCAVPAVAAIIPAGVVWAVARRRVRATERRPR